MAIWSSVGKKATETTAEVVKKAQNMAEVSKINNQILEEERKRDDIYRKIGVLYASVQGSQKDPAFASLLEELEQSNGAIRAYEDQILSLKNAYRCTCGAVVSKDNFFCPECGSRTPRTAGTPLSCPECGHAVAPGDVYCTGCGKKIELDEKKYCPVCSEPIEAGSKFCTRCGNKLQDSCPAPQEAQNEEEPTPPATALPEQPPMAPTPDKVCARCGAKIEEGNAFCAKCGAAYADAEKSSLPDKKICPNCGAKIDCENSFCTECGTKLPA